MLIKFFFLAGVIVNGLINVSISTIERRFDLKTSQFAPVASAYDFASFCVLIPLTYFGGRATASKPRWIGFGVLLMAIGSLVFALPHFLAGNYKAVSGELDVCQGTATGGGGGQDATGNSTLVGNDFQESHQRSLWALSNKYVTKVTNGLFSTSSSSQFRTTSDTDQQRLRITHGPCGSLSWHNCFMERGQHLCSHSASLTSMRMCPRKCPRFIWVRKGRG